jgi:hypothetical protein
MRRQILGCWLSPVDRIGARSVAPAGNEAAGSEAAGSEAAGNETAGSDRATARCAGQ